MVSMSKMAVSPYYTKGQDSLCRENIVIVRTDVGVDTSERTTVRGIDVRELDVLEKGVSPQLFDADGRGTYALVHGVAVAAAAVELAVVLDLG